uniref:ATP synthase complex subunit 8 n=1 Tax=Nesomachilis australica TaxID=299218 RepID=Q5C850_9INSE|nr:ATP synthase F0 subunit 8 [Nesomachilis australica]AAV50266.1 ATP synthase F0 subunit 8 [Nesomachilis australica]
MPQMSPLMWLILFFLFSAVFIVFLIVNHYNFWVSPNSNKFYNKIYSSPKHWSW